LPLFLASQHHDTLQAIESSGLLPFDGDVQGVTKKTESFKDHDEAITRNLSHILLLAMNILHGMHGKAKHALFGEGSRQAVSSSLPELPCSLNIYSTQTLVEIRKRARSLMMFAGMQRYRMSADIYAQLTRLDVAIAH